MRRFAPTAFGVACCLVPTAVAGVPQPSPIGVGVGYRPAAISAAVAQARPIAGLRCTKTSPRRTHAHVELFANRRVVIVPAGIGVSPPIRGSSTLVRGGRCSYPIRTTTPTGIVEVMEGRRLTVGDLFAVWGRRLSRSQLLGFHARRGQSVAAFVAGRAFLGDPRSIVLAPGSQVVLEIGGYVAPHRTFVFPKGLS